MPAAVFRKPEAEGRYFLSQAASVGFRSALGVWRDRAGLTVTAFLPVCLALLISFTQARQTPTIYASFFLVVAALWMGMTLTVREIVNERKLYVRDRLAGLTPGAFLCGRFAVFAAVGCLQAMILLFMTDVMSAFLVWWGMGRQAGLPSFLPVFSIMILPCVAMGGVLLGFIVSTLAATEQTAVSCLPLLLLPQVLVSRVAAGFGGDTWSARDPNPFISIDRIGEFLRGVFFGDDPLLHRAWDLIMFIISQPLFTRPGTAALDLLRQFGVGRASGGEFILLATLLFVHLLVWVFVFRRKEKTWTIR